MPIVWKGVTASRLIAREEEPPRRVNRETARIVGVGPGFARPGQASPPTTASSAMASCCARPRIEPAVGKTASSSTGCAAKPLSSTEMDCFSFIAGLRIEVRDGNDAVLLVGVEDETVRRRPREMAPARSLRRRHGRRGRRRQLACLQIQRPGQRLVEDGIVGDDELRKDRSGSCASSAR